MADARREELIARLESFTNDDIDRLYGLLDTFSVSEVAASDTPIRCPCGDNIERGRMVVCDGPCKAWKHYECVGLRRKPRGTWLFPECKKLLAAAPRSAAARLGGAAAARSAPPSQAAQAARVAHTPPLPRKL